MHIVILRSVSYIQFTTTVSGSFSDTLSSISSVYTGDKLKIDYRKLNELLENYNPSLAIFGGIPYRTLKKIFHNINMSISLLANRPDGEPYKDRPNTMSQ